MQSVEERKQNFINKAVEKFNNKYDYSKVNYINQQTKVCIICPEHGEFWQTPADHIKYNGCKKCQNIERGYNTFISKGKIIHNNKYDYSKVKYVDYQTKVCIICPEHGEFWQTPADHISYKHECRKCAANKRGFNKRIGLQNFINKANKLHNYKYDYSKFNYVNNGYKSIIICPDHGEFLQSPAVHLRPNGCPICGNIECHNKQRKPLEQFINECNKVHKNKYNYSKVTLEDYKIGKIKIICPIHGEFEQNRKKHLFGQGCPKCSDSSMEKMVETKLIEHNILYETQKKFDWLRYKLPLKLDFYLPNYNIAIECQGIQHFIPIGYNRKQKENKKEIQNSFDLGLYRDELKHDLCIEHGIKILYFSTINKDYKYDIIHNIDNLIETIKLIDYE